MCYSTMNFIIHRLIFRIFHHKNLDTKLIFSSSINRLKMIINFISLIKICQICELRSGVTISCDAGLCPNAFHASCANKNGLLQIRGELVCYHSRNNFIELYLFEKLSFNNIQRISLVQTFEYSFFYIYFVQENVSNDI